MTTTPTITPKPRRRCLQFSLRTLLICMTLVGPGILALQHSGEWVFTAVTLVVVFGISFAVKSALGNAGIRRLSWAILAACMCAPLLGILMLPPLESHAVFYLTAIIAITAFVAYIMPWLAKRRHRHA